MIIMLMTIVMIMMIMLIITKWWFWILWWLCDSMRKMQLIPNTSRQRRQIWNILISHPKAGHLQILICLVIIWTLMDIWWKWRWRWQCCWWPWRWQCCWWRWRWPWPWRWQWCLARPGALLFTVGAALPRGSQVCSSLWSNNNNNNKNKMHKI